MEFIIGAEDMPMGLGMKEEPPKFGKAP